MRRLAKETGQRIRITTDTDGSILADSDILAGRTPCKTGSEPPLLIGPRSEPKIPDSSGAAKITVVAIGDYHLQTRYAACSPKPTS